MLAEKMFEDVGEGANVVILATPNSGSQARADGFRTVCKKNKMNIIFDGDGGGEVELANSVMQDLLQACLLYTSNARAAVLDYDKLIDVLQKKEIQGAALDVYPIEPLPHDHPLLDLRCV